MKPIIILITLSFLALSCNREKSQEQLKAEAKAGIIEAIKKTEGAAAIDIYKVKVSIDSVKMVSEKDAYKDLYELYKVFARGVIGEKYLPKANYCYNRMKDASDKPTYYHIWGQVNRLVSGQSQTGKFESTLSPQFYRLPTTEEEEKELALLMQ